MTSAFLAPLRFEDDGGFPFTLLTAVVYVSAGQDRVFVVPAGFKTDLASIPRPLWNILPPIGAYDAAAVVHDHCYRTRAVSSRAAADSVLREAMAVLGVSGLTRWLIYTGVRAGGWRAWRRYRAATPAPVTA